ncbi:hypothetical protein CEP51_010451 [Fusarium floridanum]|uniref:ABC transporter domain-containing protein n=1 Tax=Fusarium floridanum TaxID=1325733 RepID=A0A428REJ0_9HYPO|nr:hypothetical protein CEP51_010451 [Fusarium floridanum]
MCLNSIHTILVVLNRYATTRIYLEMHLATTPPPSSSKTSVDDTEETIGDIARQVTRASTHRPEDGENNAINPRKGSNLDPFSPNFDVSAWTRAFIDIFDADPDAAPHRTVGVAFKDLNIYGYTTGNQYQESVGNILLSAVSSMVRRVTGRAKDKVNILQGFDGIVEPGEMLLVLGPPGSGCSTLLKTLAGRNEALEVSKDSLLNYRGIGPEDMYTRFRGDIMYNAEVDVHLPPLTVGDTLEFAARARVPSVVPGGFTSKQFARILRDVTMAMFRITHTMDSKVGDDFIRGVSGGERKRVSIAEAALIRAKLQCWDNSTRGLDSDNAISFCETLRVFDKVTVLYQGHQIYFGSTKDAKRYFENLGFESPERQTTADFLTSMTSPHERRIRPGWEDVAPRTPEEFAARWKESQERKALVAQLAVYQDDHPRDVRLEAFSTSHKAERSSSQREKSPYTITYLGQIRLCLWRSWKRLVADPQYTVSQLIFNLVMGFVLGSMFYDLAPDTSSFYYRGGLIFFAMLFNALASELEVLTLYAQRPVVEKHNHYALYHQSAEAIASYIMELPYKTLNTIVFNPILYFLAQLRQEAGAVFFFILVGYLVLLAMSGVYRTIACLTRTSHQAMVPSTILTLGLMLYSGFVLPVESMRGWARWINYINPLAYAFEALMVNELHGREFPCAQVIPSGPGYETLKASQSVCAVVGAVPGSTVVDGGAFIEGTYKYYNAHKWRNVGILFGYVLFFCFTYVVSAEYSRPAPSRGEVLVFRRSKSSPAAQKHRKDVEHQFTGQQPMAESSIESSGQEVAEPKHSVPSLCGKSVFHWEDVCYDISIKGKNRRILDHVDGWVQPGVTTVLMGASGAGKTTLLDSLAGRVSTGVLSGHTLVNGQETDRSFPHQIGYVQQQDLHLNTMTVREALEFSALLRQSEEIPSSEKLAYVDEVVSILDMAEYVDAIIGVPGEGLNVEQRKRLTIGIELAARPQLLIFFDEPTSGLDSQTLVAKLYTLVSLFIGFSFHANNSLQGLQNQLYAIFMCLLIFNPFSKQIMPMFIPQRALYEVRERPSKIYRWTTFILSNVLIELIWNTFAAAIFFFCWYYPAGFVKNTTSDDIHIRGFTVFLFLWQLMLWISTFSQLAISAIETADLAGVPASLVSVLCMAFCGVGVARGDLPSIWRDFMYRVSPFTYLVSGALTTGLHGSAVTCTSKELVHVPRDEDVNCTSFLSAFVERVGGYLADPVATNDCQYCPMATTDQFLSQFDMAYDDRWRNFGIGWVFIIFNIAATCGLYWLVRVPRR